MAAPGYVDVSYTAVPNLGFVSLYAMGSSVVQFSSLQILSALNLLLSMPGGSLAAVTQALSAAGITGTPVDVRLISDHFTDPH